MPKSNKAAPKGISKDQNAPDKLPKRIAGTKVPKQVRKSGLWSGWVNSPLGRELIASALVAAAAAIVGDKGARQSKKASAGQAKGGSSRIAQAVADAAIDMVSRGLGGSDQQPPAPAQDVAGGKRRGSRKDKLAGEAPASTH